jgi:hypothetical protein
VEPPQEIEAAAPSAVVATPVAPDTDALLPAVEPAAVETPAIEPEPVPHPPPAPAPEPAAQPVTGALEAAAPIATPEPAILRPFEPLAAVDAAPAAPGPMPSRSPVAADDRRGPATVPTTVVQGIGPVWTMVLLLFFSILSAVAGFVAGYFLGGARQPTAPAGTAQPPATPAVPQEKQPDATPVLPPDPPAEPLPEKVAPAPAEPPASEIEPPAPDAAATPAEPLRLLAAPEAALKAFLSAPDWQARAKLVLDAERVAAKMELYHSEAPDGPTAALSLSADAAHDEDVQGPRLVTYRVATEAAPAGFPVAVVETPAGWKVDWESFIEFRDDHFRRFAAGEGSAEGAFHLMVRNTHYFGEPFPGSDKLTAFRVDPPLPDREQYAFVPTGSELHKTLAAATEWGRPCTPVLELVRKEHAPGKTHLEITRIAAPNWRPQ